MPNPNHVVSTDVYIYISQFVSIRFANLIESLYTTMPIFDAKKISRELGDVYWFLFLFMKSNLMSFLVKPEGPVIKLYHLSWFTWVTLSPSARFQPPAQWPSRVDLAELSGGSGEKILYRWKLQWKSMEYEPEK